MTPRFFPYRPTVLRTALLAIATASAALGAAALRHGLQGASLAWPRAVAAALLTGAFLWLVWRLRPRDGYGVRVDPAGAELARALDGRLERVLWNELAGVRQTGRWSPRWVLELHDGTRRELPRALFASGSVFADLGRALTRPDAVSRAEA
jgi:hypothetical protein